jgi:hypothetical protein
MLRKPAVANWMAGLFKTWQNGQFIMITAELHVKQRNNRWAFDISLRSKNTPLPPPPRASSTEQQQKKTG